jgi:outer membrane receptor protein involved in Fe transport
VVVATVPAPSDAGPDAQTVTGPDGRFSLDVSASGPIVVTVRAGGFAEYVRILSESERTQRLDVMLSLAPLSETITVTSTRGEQRAGDVPASINVLSGEQIRLSPAVVADDVLRQVPTFSLFRRSSSLSSHPTTQGVSLRGIGPSGVSRTLVLMDGIPFNDPFGGWVYWTRVPLASIDRVELVDGANSSLYGSYAMGGVVNILGSRPARRTLEVGAQYGNLASPKGDFFASNTWSRVGVAVEGSAFGTDGFPIVAESERGKVDNNATVNFANLSAKGDYQATPRMNVFARGGYFRENRDNGKMSTIDGTEEANRTRWTSASGGVRMLLPDQSDLQARVFSDFETFHSNFLAVPTATPPRSIGRMTLNQRVPTTGVGGVVQWGRAFGARHDFQAGVDWRWVDGESQEEGLDPVKGQTVILQRQSGGTQRSVGAFVQDVMRPLGNLTVTISARVDDWRNYNGHNLETNVPSGTPTPNNTLFPDRSDTAVSPRVAALYRVNDVISVWGDAGGGFRAPTLNELYRQFRVGTTLTLANDQLGPERLHGGEAGVTLRPLANLTVRSTWFDNRVTNPVANVTISTVGTAVTQQRQNLGRTRIWGLQNDADYRITSSVHVMGAYVYMHATVEEFEANPALVGNTLPQVPRHRGSLQFSYISQKYANVGLGLQFVGRQFDDDQNVRVVPGETAPGLPGYTSVDLSLSRAVGHDVDLFAGVQNVFNTEYIVGTLPTTIGSPRLFNAGVRIRLAGR